MSLEPSRPVRRRLAIGCLVQFLRDRRKRSRTRARTKMGSGLYFRCGRRFGLAKRFRSLADQASSPGLLVMRSAIAPSSFPRGAPRAMRGISPALRARPTATHSCCFGLSTRFRAQAATARPKFTRPTRESAPAVGALAQRPKRPHLENGERNHRQDDQIHRERHRTAFGFTLLELTVHTPSRHILVRDRGRRAAAAADDRESVRYERAPRLEMLV